MEWRDEAAPERCRSPLELEIFQLTNSFRQEQTLEPLKWHKGLAGIAKRHATAVADGRAPFSHAGAHERFASCSTKCINVAENLARSDGFVRPDLPQAAVLGWCESEGHRRNLLGPFDACGIGWAASDSGTVFVTQLLALVDERSDLRGQLCERTFDVATSTPAVCTALGLVLAGPVVAFGCGLLGSALDYKYGLKVVSLPSVVRERMMGVLRRHVCTRCGTPTDGELLMSGSDGRLLCSCCHPSPADSDVWCFID